MGYLTHAAHRYGRFGAQSYSDIYGPQIIDRTPEKKETYLITLTEDKHQPNAINKDGMITINRVFGPPI